MKLVLIKLVLLLSVASLALSAPSNIVKDKELEEKWKVDGASSNDDLKKDVNDKGSMEIIVVPDENYGDKKDQTIPKEEVKIKDDFKNNVFKKDEEIFGSVSDGEDVETEESSDSRKSYVIVSKNPEEIEENKDMLLPAYINTVLKVADEMMKKTDGMVIDIKDSIKKPDDPLKIVDSKLRDVASAVAEAVTNLPIPGKPDNPEGNKFTQIFGHFVNEMLQVPVVILHAITNAIAMMTGSVKPQPASP